MGQYLLLGAGFSKNWGAPLAKDFTGSLLADLHDDPRIAAALRANNSFEAALGELQGAAKTSKDASVRLHRLETAISELFQRINSSLSSTHFYLDPGNEISRSIGDFLGRFDAIFTLNQDLLLEARYVYIPKTTRFALLPWLNAKVDGGNMIGPNILKASWVPCSPPFQSLDKRHQPIFKLHGSSNWRTADASSMLIMGSGKAEAIGRFPVLEAYQMQFCRMLQEPQSKLMVIGYSFQDAHVNEAILDGNNRNGLGVYIIDPNGSDILRNARDPRVGIVGQKPADIESIRLIGERRRTLREIFTPAGDFDRSELFRFFE